MPLLTLRKYPIWTGTDHEIEKKRVVRIVLIVFKVIAAALVVFYFTGKQGKSEKISGEVLPLKKAM